MPTTVANITMAAAYQGELVTIPVDNTLLKGISLVEVNRRMEQIEAYGSIGIMAGGISYDHIVTVFEAGYFGNATKLGWTGNFPCDADMFLFAEIFAYTAQEFKLAATLFKIVKATAEAFLIDP